MGEMMELFIYIPHLPRDAIGNLSGTECMFYILLLLVFFIISFSVHFFEHLFAWRIASRERVRRRPFPILVEESYNNWDRLPSLRMEALLLCSSEEELLRVLRSVRPRSDDDLFYYLLIEGIARSHQERIFLREWDFNLERVREVLSELNTSELAKRGTEMIDSEKFNSLDRISKEIIMDLVIGNIASLPYEYKERLVNLSLRERIELNHEAMTSLIGSLSSEEIPRFLTYLNETLPEVFSEGRSLWKYCNLIFESLPVEAVRYLKENFRDELLGRLWKMYKDIRSGSLEFINFFQRGEWELGALELSLLVELFSSDEISSELRIKLWSFLKDLASRFSFGTVEGLLHLKVLITLIAKVSLPIRLQEEVESYVLDTLKEFFSKRVQELYTLVDSASNFSRYTSKLEDLLDYVADALKWSDKLRRLITDLLSGGNLKLMRLKFYRTLPPRYASSFISYVANFYQQGSGESKSSQNSQKLFCLKCLTFSEFRSLEEGKQVVPLCPTCSDITFLVKAEPIGWISSSERILKELNGRILVNLRRDKGIFLGEDEKLVFKEILLEKMDKEDYTKILNSFILEVESLGKLEELKEVTLLTEEPLPESARKFALKFFKEIKLLD